MSGPIPPSDAAKGYFPAPAAGVKPASAPAPPLPPKPTTKDVAGPVDKAAPPLPSPSAQTSVALVDSHDYPVKLSLGKTPSSKPIAQNKYINESYHKYDKIMDEWIGQPPVANWLTYAKHASRQVGVQIVDLNTALHALDAFKTIDGNPVNDAKALKEILALVQKDGVAAQGIKLALAKAGVTPKDIKDALASWVPGSTLPIAYKLAKALPDVVGSVKLIRDNLEKGNRNIFNNIAPAWDAFLKAEMNGQDGLAALKAAGYGQGKDPDPLNKVMQGFEKYKQAKNASTQAERDRLMHEGNLLIVEHEQLLVQPIYDTMKTELGAMGGTMILEDPTGVYKLLPGGGNWADPDTRLGFKGGKAVYTPGTISHYFQKFLTDPRLHGAPMPYSGFDR